MEAHALTYLELEADSNADLHSMGVAELQRVVAEGTIREAVISDGDVEIIGTREEMSERARAALGLLLFGNYES